MTIEEIKQRVVDYANGYGIFPEIALAQINRESRFNPNAVGGSGEHGLGQFMPGTWARFGGGRSFEVDAFDVDYNLTAWGEYMTWLLTRFNGDYVKALQGYNGGEGNVDRGTVSSAAQRYASEIIAAAGGMNVPDGSGSPVPISNPQTTDWKTYALIAAAVFGLLLLSKD